MTKIEWTDITKNPIKGKCKMGCDYCYARRFYDRFGWDPEVRFEPKVLDEIKKRRKPAKIFLCSTHEMFGHWIPDTWISQILNTILSNPRHTFQILTKNPERAKHWVFPPNCWVGVTVESKRQIWRLEVLKEIDAKVKFVSFEPLQSYFEWVPGWLDWIIVGAETGNRKGKIVPKKFWIDKLIYVARYWNIPLFLKNNLHMDIQIQQYPKRCG